MRHESNRRILIVDDNPSIHADFRKILAGDAGQSTADLDSLADALFGESSDVGEAERYEIESALQGEEALEKVAAARRAGRPFSVAFIDVRMPPGWDGVTTLAKLWQEDPDLQAVICTAFSDYSYEQMLGKLGRSQNLLILKKPFDPVEVQQLASALSQKWSITLAERLHVEEIRAYASSLETVNRALTQDKAMAEAFTRARAGLALDAAHALARIARAHDDPRDALTRCGHIGLLLEAGFAERRDAREPIELRCALDAARAAAAAAGVRLEVRTDPSVPCRVQAQPDLVAGFLALLVDAAKEAKAERLELSFACVAERNGDGRVSIAGRIAGGRIDTSRLELGAEPPLARCRGGLHIAAARALARIAGGECTVDDHDGAITVVLDLEAGPTAGAAPLSSELSGRLAA